MFKNVQKKIEKKNYWKRKLILLQNILFVEMKISKFN
jgi:hypothetical protein